MAAVLSTCNGFDREMVADVAQTSSQSPDDNCTGAPLPHGRCWHNPSSRVSNGMASSASECCERCKLAHACGVWVFWGPLNNMTSCTLFRDSAPSIACTGDESYLVGSISHPPTPPPPPPPPAPAGAKSVLMVAVDDMRPELGAYGCGHMKTPHFDAFAQDAVVFDSAYVPRSPVPPACT